MNRQVLTFSWLPNALCVLRMLLAPCTVWLLLQERYMLTLVVFVVAACTDGLDGFLAKRFGWTSELGKALDPLADKILLVAVFITLTALHFVPLWLAVLVAARDVIISAGAICFRYFYGALNGQPTLISKANTLLQITYVFAVLSVMAFALPDWGQVLSVLVWCVAGTTIFSGVDYMVTYAHRAWVLQQQRG